VALTCSVATRFKPGHAKSGPGRPKGSRDRADLSQLIMDAAVETGFVQLDEQGKPIGSGKEGCKGYLKWAAVNELALPIMAA